VAPLMLTPSTALMKVFDEIQSLSAWGVIDDPHHMGWMIGPMSTSPLQLYRLSLTILAAS
jgi:hypothetical protein